MPALFRAPLGPSGCDYLQQEGYELMETQDGTGVVIVVDYLVKTPLLVCV